MASRHQRRPVLESLEGRLVLSAAPAAHFAAEHAHVHHLAHVHHFAKHTHSPVITHLSPQQTAFEITSATYYNRSRVITIKGTLIGPAPSSSSSYLPSGYSNSAPPYTGAAQMHISARVGQATDRRGSVFGSVESEVLNSVAGQKTSFTFKLAADAGRFARGTAIVSLTAYYQYVNVSVDGSNYYSYYYYFTNPSAKMVVKLSPGRAG